METGRGRKAAPATVTSFITWLVLWATWQLMDQPHLAQDAKCSQLLLRML